MGTTLAGQTRQGAQRRESGDASPPPCGTLAAETADFARLAGSSTCPVLLTGETGSGKTYLARLIHHSGPRTCGPFVRVNCGAVPDSLFERELFGHVRGAFTDARESGEGFLEAANGGTLFLDEIGELPLQVQPKLLSVLEDGVFRKLGSPREIAVDARVIAATNCDISEMVKRKEFREDLYYRFSVLRHRVPPLRERREALPTLAHDLLRRALGADAHHRITAAALEVLCAYDWPGNVRELENALQAGLVFSRGAPIEPEHLPLEILEGPRACASASSHIGERYTAPADPALEASTIRRALAEANGNRTVAARALGMSRSTLWTKLHRYADSL